MTRAERRRSAWWALGLGLPLMTQTACATAPAAGNGATPPPPPDPASISTAVLPAASARSLLVQTCAVCHAIELVVVRKRSADEWDTLIAKMVGYGAKATDDEQEQIFQYLVQHFLADTPATPPPK
jgi:cytochrome c5